MTKVKAKTDELETSAILIQLMGVLMQSQVYSVMYTAAVKKFFMDVELLHHKF